MQKLKTVDTLRERERERERELYSNKIDVKANKAFISDDKKIGTDYILNTNIACLFCVFLSTKK